MQWNHSNHPSLDTIPFPCSCPWPLFATGQGNCRCFPYAGGSGIQVISQSWQEAEGEQYIILWGALAEEIGEGGEWKLWTRVVVLCCSTVQEQKTFLLPFSKALCSLGWIPGLPQKWMGCCANSRFHCGVWRDYFRKLKCFHLWRSLRTGQMSSSQQ